MPDAASSPEPPSRRPAGRRTTLATIDRRLRVAELATETPALPDRTWRRLASTVHNDIVRLDERTLNQLRMAVPVAPERYAEELACFEEWVGIAEANGDNPTVVRAQVTTEMYMAFVSLPESVMKQAAAAVRPGSTLARVERFLGSGRPGMLREAVARGRWSPLPDLGGIEYWTAPALGCQRAEVGPLDLHAWQLLSRGVALAAVLALTA